MDNNMIDEKERLRIDAINRIKHVQSLELSKQVLLRIEEDSRAREYYDVFITMCEINELLNKVVKFVKTHGTSSNESYSFNQKVAFEDLVPEEEFVNFALNEIIPKIDTEVFNSDDINELEERKEKRKNKAKGLYKCNLEELRLYLYDCNSIKPVIIPNIEVDKTFDYAQCFVSGVNAEAILRNEGDWFLEKKDYDYALNNNITEIITKGTIMGAKLPSREAIKDKPKKY